MIVWLACFAGVHGDRRGVRAQTSRRIERRGGRTPTPDPAPLHPKEVYPQIVRLSLVQGDVRVAVGKVKGQPGVPPWVNAAVNMPLETGFSVVTGKGRAEIEFEDASTMYLGENSVLTFDTLDDEGQCAVYGDDAAAGVADLNLHPTVPKEVYSAGDVRRTLYG